MPRSHPYHSVQVRLPPELIEWLDREAHRQKTDRSALVRALLLTVQAERLHEKES